MQANLEIDINAAPQTVFTYLVDAEKLMQWQSFLASAEQVSEGEVGVGTQFRLVIDVAQQFPQAVSVLGTQEIVLMGEVVDYAANERVEIKGESSYNTINIQYTCTATDAGTHLTQQNTLNFKNPLINAVAPMVKGLLVKRGKADLQALKQVLEA